MTASKAVIPSELLPERNLLGLAVFKIRAGPRQSTVIHPNPGLDCGCIAGVLFRLKALEYGTEFSVNTLTILTSLEPCHRCFA